MKNLGLFCLLLTCVGFGGCNKKDSQKEDQVAQSKAEKPISIQCYKSRYEKDTIDLKINTLKSGKITGNMLMKIADMPNKIGEIAGEFHGDTLFVAYTFIQGTNDKITFKNPMAFLKHGDELILGNGKIETTMGASYFVKGEPIDFERVKYKFNKVECSGK